jgi:thiamine transporter ThiT
MDDSRNKPNAALDQTAVALSGLCLLHCLALPFFIGLLPFAGQFGDDHFHLQMLFVVIPVSVLAFGLGFRRHGRAGVLAGGTVGLLLLTAGATVVHSRMGVVADQIFTVSAATILAISHFYNSRYSKRHKRS